MKQGWKIQTLGDVATFINGDRSTNYPSKKDYVIDGIPFVNAGNLIQAGLDLESLNLISQNKYDSLTQGKFVEGDILFCLRGTLGKHSIVQNGLNGAIASSLVIIRTKDGFNNKYISYFLDYKQPYIERLNNGAAQPNIPAKTMKGFPILLPPNEKQQQSIVDFLDSAFSKIDAIKKNAEKQLAEARALFQSALNQAMQPKPCWQEYKIMEIGEVIGGTTPNTNNPNYWGGNICWISPAELHGEKYLYDSVKKITEDAVKAKSLKQLPIGTVILSSRAPIGKVAINKVPMYCNQGFKCIVCGPKIFNEFLYWWLWGNTAYLNSIGTGATFAEISKTVVQNIRIHIPLKSEQEIIADRLDKYYNFVHRLEVIHNKTISECDALKQALLRQIFE